ncbi:conserved hypothetical protein [Leishmania mexicana MHOM/GT/2001/U1103]|uniref:Uncharacterized protein n=1 Tax=Leishmania mexicana (strain MHOM/GT/2001/U1103) TaxID=929439 RepID=E9AKP7_LEIMU|nr:conserved hypothetical protein [Leishmania mexicana MHOM/GT/2001/U1103]CBZ23498.1 conserved hypothetical protein [Leishmania mexicana MHOM/GT/2001/U1103]
MVDRSCRGGATSKLTNAEVGAFYLTALVAQALRLEDYWVHLGHQIEVDQHVEFIQYCAREGFEALKTMHLLSWWRQYRSLVRGDADVSTETPIAPLLLSDGSPQRNAPPSHFHSGNASGGSAGGGEHGSAGGSALSHGKEGSGGKASKKGRRSSAITTAGATPSSEQDVLAGTSTSLSAAAPTPLLYATHAEALHGELQRFVEWELEHEWAWRQVPREPVVSAAVALTSPRSTSLSSGPLRSISGVTAAGVAKPSRAEKAKLQQLQQQEMEAEEQRLARVAAMPPENIFLTRDELEGFLQFVVEEGLLSHTALHMCVTSDAQQPMSTLSGSTRAPVCFSVQVETPMSVLPLREATRLSALQRSSGSGNVSAVSATRDEAAGGDATVGDTGTPQLSPRRTSTSGHGKPVSGRPRAHSKRAIKGASKDAAAATAAEAAAAAASNPPTAPELTAPLTAMEALRAEQAKEAAAYRAAYEEELAQTAAHQQAEQHAADVHLFFEKPRTNEAVQAVYASIEDALAARQQRILQRVVALERALGLSTPSAESGRLDSAGANSDGSGAAAAASQPTTAREANSSGGSTHGKRKAK